eukprot:tig00021432_g21243.t1
MATLKTMADELQRSRRQLSCNTATTPRTSRRRDLNNEQAEQTLAALADITFEQNAELAALEAEIAGLRSEAVRARQECTSVVEAARQRVAAVEEREREWLADRDRLVQRVNDLRARELKMEGELQAARHECQPLLEELRDYAAREAEWVAERAHMMAQLRRPPPGAPESPAGEAAVPRAPPRQPLPPPAPPPPPPPHGRLIRSRNRALEGGAKRVERVSAQGGTEGAAWGPGSSVRGPGAAAGAWRRGSQREAWGPGAGPEAGGRRAGVGAGPWAAKLPGAVILENITLKAAPPARPAAACLTRPQERVLELERAVAQLLAELHDPGRPGGPGALPARSPPPQSPPRPPAPPRASLRAERVQGGAGGWRGGAAGGERGAAGGAGGCGGRLRAQEAALAEQSRIHALLARLGSENARLGAEARPPRLASRPAPPDPRPQVNRLQAALTQGQAGAPAEAAPAAAPPQRPPRRLRGPHRSRPPAGILLLAAPPSTPEGGGLSPAPLRPAPAGARPRAAPSRACRSRPGARPPRPALDRLLRVRAGAGTPPTAPPLLPASRPSPSPPRPRPPAPAPPHPRPAPAPLPRPPPPRRGGGEGGAGRGPVPVVPLVTALRNPCVGGVPPQAPSLFEGAGREALAEARREWRAMLAGPQAALSPPGGTVPDGRREIASLVGRSPL